jgi:hypothetical protein
MYLNYIKFKAAYKNMLSKLTFQRHWILWSQRMRSVVTHTGGTVQALNSVGNTRTDPVVERVEGV